MKKIITILLALVLSNFGVAQINENEITPKNSIIITPLGDLLNDSKSSIYFCRVLEDDSEKYLSFRIGTEVFNSINHEFSSGREEKSSFLNFKTGIEMGKKINKGIVYFGPEISYTVSKINGASLLPNENVIFSTNSIAAEEWSAINETKVSIFSIIGFVGFKYKLTNHFSLGIESAIGVGWYSSTLEYRSLSLADGHDKGVVKDLSINRFILLEYSF